MDNKTDSLPAKAAPAPASPDASALEARIRELEMDRAKLEAHKATMDRDAEKARKKATEAEEKLTALRKLALGDDAKDADPREILARREEAARQASLSALQFQATLSRSLLASGLLPKDNDADLLEYRIDRSADLKVLADAGKTAELIEMLKARGYVAAPASVAPAQVPPAPRPAPPSLQNEPANPRFAHVQTFSDLSKMGFAAMREFEMQYPERFTELQQRSRDGYAMPARRYQVSGTQTLGDGSGQKTFKTVQPDAAQTKGKL